ncbi:MAG: hypothetical protein BJ554DRAFT_7512 [Olpidium bornovanus]|uniref:Uncharacterized protein n=1 Tax=Olpidium bornovanus TaxID=278681 RepID=A0A8H8DMI4_9FUNG|nr:MAG: hypothetical protein BJ554DRAFT_7512 [Olpidium bornovanus]
MSPCTPSVIRAVGNNSNSNGAVGSEITVVKSLVVKEAGLPYDPRPGWTMVTSTGENPLAGAC